jgi:hypothetical protein
VQAPQGAGWRSGRQPETRLAENLAAIRRAYVRPRGRLRDDRLRHQRGLPALLARPPRSHVRDDRARPGPGAGTPRGSARSGFYLDTPFRQLKVHKAARFLCKLEQVDAEKRLEFLLMNVVREFSDLGVNHGPYDRGKFKDRVQEVRISTGIFLIWSETYCHTLTEAWAAGVPALPPKNWNSGTWAPRAKRCL